MHAHEADAPLADARPRECELAQVEHVLRRVARAFEREEGRKEKKKVNEC